MCFVTHALVNNGDQKQDIEFSSHARQTLLSCSDILVRPLHDRNKPATGVPVSLNAVACRAVAMLRPRGERIYQIHFWETAW
jgi:hypothetical protein